MVLQYFLLVFLIVGVCEASFKMKRSPKPKPDDDTKKQPSWKPVSEPQEFTVMVDDNINKADQFRHETWKPGGIIEGEYAAPTRYLNSQFTFNILTYKILFPPINGLIVSLYFIKFFRDGKWLKVNYRADKEGFHVLSQKVVSESDLNLPSGGGASDHQAKVETQVNGKDVKYTVKEEDLKKAKDKQQQPPPGL